MDNLNIFLDSDALYAINDKDDYLHKRAVKILKDLVLYKPALFISTNIIMETTTLISQRIGKKEAINLLQEVRSGNYRLVHPDGELILKGEEIFKSIKSKNVSYSDCISFAVLRSLGIELVFSFGSHFKKQGFKRVGIDIRLS